MKPERSSPLRRRLFRWFTAAIVTSVAFGTALGGLLWFLNHREHHQHPIERFAAMRVAEQWQNPPARTQLLREIGLELTFGVQLRDPAGNVLESFGERCARPHASVPVNAISGVHLGDMDLCQPRGGPGPDGKGHGPPMFGWRILITIFVALLVMWAASGRVARQLAAPLQDLAKVADDLGQGKLSSRAALSSRHHGVDELDSLATSINEMATRIERQLHDQKELLAAVSHELRTPLGHAKLLIEMARDQPDEQKPLDELERELAELERMVGQLLASARLDFTARAEQDVDAIQLAVRVLDRAGVDAALLQVQTEQTTVHGDPALLAQALANLLDNALRHGGNLVALRIRSQGEFLTFEALDNGPGFPDGQAETAFEPFRRGPASHGGLGLGLTLVRRIVLAHGGRVNAGNRPEGGACVSISVPVLPQSLKS